MQRSTWRYIAVISTMFMMLSRRSGQCSRSIFAHSSTSRSPSHLGGPWSAQAARMTFMSDPPVAEENTNPMLPAASHDGPTKRVMYGSIVGLSASGSVVEVRQQRWIGGQAHRNRQERTPSLGENISLNRSRIRCSSPQPILEWRPHQSWPRALVGAIRHSQSRWRRDFQTHGQTRSLNQPPAFDNIFSQGKNRA